MLMRTCAFFCMNMCLLNVSLNCNNWFSTGTSVFKQIAGCLTSPSPLQSFLDQFIYSHAGR